MCKIKNLSILLLLVGSVCVLSGCTWALTKQGAPASSPTATAVPTPSPTPMYTEETWPYSFEKDEIHIGVLDWGYSTVTEDMMREMKEIGIDFFVGGMDSYMLENCQSTGLYAFPAGYNFPLMSANERIFTEEAYINTMKYVRAHPSMAGDYTADQLHISRFSALKQALEQYHAKQPKSLPFLSVPPLYMGNLEERCGTADYQLYLDTFLKEVPAHYLCAELFPYDLEWEGLYPRYLENLDILSQTARAHNKELWLFSQAGTFSLFKKPSEDQLMWQAYMSLAYGVNGFFHVSATPFMWHDTTSLFDWSGNKNTTFDRVAKVNKVLKDLSPIFMQYYNIGVTGIYDRITITYKDQLDAQKERNAARGLTDEVLLPFTEWSTDEALFAGVFQAKENADRPGSRAVLLVNFINPYVEDGRKDPENFNFSTATFTVKDGQTVTAWIEGAPVKLDPDSGNTYSLKIAHGEGVFLIIE